MKRKSLDGVSDRVYFRRVRLTIFLFAIVFGGFISLFDGEFIFLWFVAFGFFINTLFEV